MDFRFVGGQLGSDDDNGYIVPMDELSHDEHHKYDSDKTKL